MIFIRYKNYKGGVNNLCVVTDSETGLIATSTKGKERAIALLDHKITLHRKEKQAHERATRQEKYS